jgi:hypothetical protein
MVYLPRDYVRPLAVVSRTVGTGRNQGLHPPRVIPAKTGGTARRPSPERLDAAVMTTKPPYVASLSEIKPAFENELGS